jgi:hypothetical protein
MPERSQAGSVTRASFFRDLLGEPLCRLHCVRCAASARDVSPHSRQDAASWAAQRVVLEHSRRNGPPPSCPIRDIMTNRRGLSPHLDSCPSPYCPGRSAPPQLADVSWAIPLSRARHGRRSDNQIRLKPLVRFPALLNRFRIDRKAKSARGTICSAGEDGNRDHVGGRHHLAQPVPPVGVPGTVHLRPRGVFDHAADDPLPGQ